MSYRGYIRRLVDKHPELHLHRNQYNFTVTANQLGNKITPKAVHEIQASEKPDTTRAAHLYFHLPLCNYICKFCNFVKTLAPTDEGKREATLDTWAETLRLESENLLKRAPWVAHSRVDSIYFGGGTSALFRKRHLESLLTHIRSNYNLARNCEVTLEGNPDNFYDREYVEMCQSIGFNRFSLGVQSLQDEVNKYAGRGHDRSLTLQAVDALKATGRPFNVDLIYGLPLQTPDSFAADVSTLIDLKVPTITTYRLRNNDRKTLHLGTTSVWNRYDKGLKKKVSETVTTTKAEEFPTFDDTYEMREKVMGLLYDNE
jgi:oxygen-independent coproporphyrinogen-3 oxidase